MKPRARTGIEVSLLPGDAGIAGEWYLAIPEYSAAPDIGLEMIKLMTTPEAELDRLRMGVGLPTRLEFYEKGGSNKTTSISPYFSMDAPEIGRLVQRQRGNVLRRSDFACYFDLSGILTFHLQEIIEISEPSTKHAREGLTAPLSGIFESLRSRMSFIHSRRNCTRCRMKRRMLPKVPRSS